MKNPKPRASWPGLLLLCMLCYGPFSCARAAPKELDASLVELRSALPVDPTLNVIVVSFDALRADALGVYGYSRGTSPLIDEFAKRSVVFESAYTAAPVSPTSFASAFTGMLPWRVFRGWNLGHDETLALQFSEAGYSTAAFINNVHLSPERHFDTGFDTYDYHENDPDEDILQSALSWLGDHTDDRLFVWVHFLTPHSPYDYRDFAAHLYDDTYEGEFSKTTRGLFDADAPEDIRRIRDLYDGEVLYADRLFQQFLDGLEELGMLETSVVVLTADHGEEFKEHGGFQHGKLYEETVRIPLIIRHPGRIEGSRSSLLVSNLDLFPTLLGVVGIEYDRKMDGKNLISIRIPPNLLLGTSMTGVAERWMSYRRGHFKLIQECKPATNQYLLGAVELYDLETDPEELINLAAEHPGLAGELQRELREIVGGELCTVMQAAMAGVGITVGMDDKGIEALRALGYVGDD